jgi:hypothetical protein
MEDSIESADLAKPEQPAGEGKPIPLIYRFVGELAPLFAAKAKARLAFEPIEKNRTVTVYPKERDGRKPPPYTFDYATLDSVRASCDRALAENGLDVFHFPVDGLDGTELHTMLTHSSGAYIETVLLLRNVEGWQAFGSAATYAQRYSYVAIVGVAAEHDDDGNAADGNAVADMRPKTIQHPPQSPQAAPKAQPQPKPAPAPKAAPVAAEKPVDTEVGQPAPRGIFVVADDGPMTDEQSAQIRDLMQRAGKKTRGDATDYMRKITGCEKSSELTKLKADMLIIALRHEVV